MNTGAIAFIVAIAVLAVIAFAITSYMSWQETARKNEVRRNWLKRVEELKLAGYYHHFWYAEDDPCGHDWRRIMNILSQAGIPDENIECFGNRFEYLSKSPKSALNVAV